MYVWIHSHGSEEEPEAGGMVVVRRREAVYSPRQAHGRLALDGAAKAAEHITHHASGREEKEHHGPTVLVDPAMMLTILLAALATEGVGRGVVQKARARRIRGIQGSI